MADLETTTTEQAAVEQAKVPKKRGRKQLTPEMKKKEVTSYSVKIAETTAEKVQALAAAKGCAVARLVKDEILRISVFKQKKIPFVRMMQGIPHVALTFRFQASYRETIQRIADNNGVTVVDVIRHACNEILAAEGRKKAKPAKKATTEKTEA